MTKQRFKIVIKISSHPEHVHTSLPPCWLPTLDHKGHNYFTTPKSHKANVSLTHGYRTTVANTRFLQTGQPHVIPYSNSHLSDDFHQYTTDSLLSYNRRKYKIPQKGQAYQKSCQKMSFGFPIKSHPIQKILTYTRASQ